MNALLSKHICVMKEVRITSFPDISWYTLQVPYDRVLGMFRLFAVNTDVYKVGDTLYCFYNHNGRPLQLVYNGEPYYYILNLQGDVYRLVDGKGTMVAQYFYDPWGK